LASDDRPAADPALPPSTGEQLRAMNSTTMPAAICGPSGEVAAALRQNAEAEIARIAGFAQGVLGLAARHLQTGAALGHRDAEFFPMASTVKVPIALTVLDMVDRGELDLQGPVAVEPREMNPSGPLADEFLHPGVTLSVLNLLEPMITRSDNTATDVLLRLAGGPQGVARRLDRLGVAEVRPSRSIRDLLCVLYGLAPPPPAVALRDVLRAAAPEALAAMRAKAQDRNPLYTDDPRDQATPRGMAELLRRLWQEDGVSHAASTTLLGIMGRTSTGLRRIAGRLPKGATVADKTGSAAGTTNDAGFITLPAGRGTMALVVFIKGSALAPADREDLIADAARCAYDYFTLTTRGG
jgi:beta-lactamase class A